MIVDFTPEALEELNYWRRTNPGKVKKIKSLLNSILETPFSGIGKPEPLMFQLSGYWSRRIDKEHRLVYRVLKGAVLIVSCRYHY